jgi:head-tail adaptor
MSLTTSELTSMRACADTMLPDTCTIQRVTRTADGMGGYSETWADLATSVMCRAGTVNDAGGSEAVLKSLAPGTVLDLILTLKYNQDIDVKDRVVYASKTYQVEAVRNDHSWVTAARAYLSRVE